MSQIARRLHGNKELPAGIDRADIENLDINDPKWRDRTVAERFAAVLAQVDSGDAEQVTERSSKQLQRYGKGDDIPLKVLIGLARLAGIPFSWIVEGPETEKLADLLAQLKRSTVSRGAAITLPLYDIRASAGRGSLVPSEAVNDYVAVGRDWLRRQLPAWAPPNAKVGILEDNGDSMEPTIRDGDLIMVVEDVPWRAVEKGGIFIFALDEHLLLKRLQILMNGDLKIISDNKAYEPELVEFKELPHRFRLIAQVFFAGGGLRSLGEFR